jgi:hypothetical protein
MTLGTSDTWPRLGLRSRGTLGHFRDQQERFCNGIPSEGGIEPSDPIKRDRGRRARHEHGGALAPPRARRTAPRHRARKAALRRRERVAHTSGPSHARAALRAASKAAGPRRGPAAPRRTEPDRASSRAAPGASRAAPGGTPRLGAAPPRTHVLRAWRGGRAGEGRRG